MTSSPRRPDTELDDSAWGPPGWFPGCFAEDRPRPQVCAGADQPFPFALEGGLLPSTALVFSLLFLMTHHATSEPGSGRPADRSRSPPQPVLLRSEAGQQTAVLGHPVPHDRLHPWLTKQTGQSRTYGSGLGQIEVGIRGHVGFHAEGAEGRLTWGSPGGPDEPWDVGSDGYTTPISSDAGSDGAAVDRQSHRWGVFSPPGLTGEAAALGWHDLMRPSARRR